MKGLGILLMIVGVCLGLYVGVWWAFIGGILDIVYAVRADVLIIIDVFIGLAKMFFAGLIGWATGACLILPGIAMYGDD